MTIGLSSFVLGSPLTSVGLRQFPLLAELGYGLIEVAYEPHAGVGAKDVLAAARDAGLRLSVAGDFTRTRDLSADSAAEREEGRQYLVDCVDHAAELGADVVAGPMYSAAGKARLASQGVRRQQWAHAVEGIGRVADYARERGVRLAIEPLNRFETDLVNTVDQGLRLCEDIGRDNVGLSLDTFHMNIEEGALDRAIVAAGARLFSFQASENDRGTPGVGHIPWGVVFDTLREVEYRGPVIVEAFEIGDNPALASALSLWRPVAPSMAQLARDAIAFIAPQWRR